MFTGDDSYSLEPWLMTPLKHEIPGTPRFQYNEDLCSARSCVERLFSVWKSVFRCLSEQRRLMYEPGMTGKIVNACAVLHNIQVAHNLRDVPVNEMEIEAFYYMNRPNVAIEENEVGYAFQGQTLAIRIQNNFIARQYGRL